MSFVARRCGSLFPPEEQSESIPGGLLKPRFKIGSCFDRIGANTIAPHHGHGIPRRTMVDQWYTMSPYRRVPWHREFLSNHKESGLTVVAFRWMKMGGNQLSHCQKSTIQS